MVYSNVHKIFYAFRGPIVPRSIDQEVNVQGLLYL